MARLQAAARDDDLVAVGADLEPGTLLAAYRNGLFPMGVERVDAMGWWSPAHRGVLRLDDLAVSRSLRRSARRMTATVDADFAAVVDACAHSGRRGDWISPAISAAYTRLHRLGWAHSVEVWADGELAGGLYGVGIGGLFAGESMFHRASDASKVALVALVEVLRSGPGTALIDVQWETGHLASLGVRAVPRAEYVAALPGLVERPGPDWSAWAGCRWTPLAPPPPG